jgi:hypothetical protein
MSRYSWTQDDYGPGAWPIPAWAHGAIIAGVLLLVAVVR